MSEKKLSLKDKRQHRVRMKIRQSANRPRLTVFRSNKYIYVQIIDDQSGRTLVSANQKDVTGQRKGKKTDSSFAVGKLLAEKAKKKKIGEVVFDRGSFAYHGRVKAVADGTREGGLKF